MKQAALETLEPWAKKALNKIPTERRRTVQTFLEHLSDSQRELATLHHYLSAIQTLNHSKKPYKQLSETEMREWARGLDKEYADSSATAYKIKVKNFLRWVHTGKLKGKKYPKCVSWLELPQARKSLGKDILSQDEIRQLVDVAECQRDRALLFVAYEGGARASELMNLKIGDVEFDEYGAVIRVNGKTGERRARIFESIPDLQLWMGMNPCKDDPSAPLWPGRSAKIIVDPKTKESKRVFLSIGRKHFFDLVRKYAEKAGIKKKVSPHSFRHSRATHLATVFKEAQSREFFGWTKASDMPSIYVHLSGRDVDETLFKHYGIVKEPENGNGTNPLKKKVCPRCSAENSVTARFCWRCWIAFDTYQADEVTATVIEEFMKRAPELLAAIVKEKGLNQRIAELVPSTEKQAA